MSNWNQFSWSRACIELVLGASIALLLYLAIMNLVVSKSLLFSVDARRIIEVYKFCSSLGTASHKSSNFIIGSSITVEGIDADILDQALNNGTSTYNLGVVGLTSVEALILEPALKAGKPHNRRVRRRHNRARSGLMPPNPNESQIRAAALPNRSRRAVSPRRSKD